MKFLCNQKGMRTIQYFGGKTKVAKQIVEYLESVRKEQQTYIEPFIGGGIICSKMSGNRIASDYNEYLIEMYNAVQTGYELPEEITKEQLNLECQRCNVIRTDNVNDAVRVIEDTLHIHDYKVIDDREIRVYSNEISRASLNRTLNEKGVDVDEIFETGIKLEDYFKSLLTD